MPVSDLGRDRFDREVFQDTRNDFDALAPYLSDHAAQRLAQEVIDRLSGPDDDPEEAASDPRAWEILELVRLLTSGDGEGAADAVARLLDKGYDTEEVYLVHLASVARTLGGMWETDALSFSQVTLATSRIYSILRGLRPGPGAPLGPVQGHAVFASAPGEDHTLGVSMAADLFRRRGWEIDLLVGMQHEAILSEIDRSEAMLIGISGAGLTVADSMARLVTSLRSARPKAYVLIAGQIVRDAPDVVRLMGADAVAVDAVLAERKLRLLSEIVSTG